MLIFNLNSTLTEYKEISALIDSGLEFICDNDGLKFFRKPKVAIGAFFVLGSVVAPPIGFEPMTNWLTARRSAGLSHGGK